MVVIDRVSTLPANTEDKAGRVVIWGKRVEEEERLIIVGGVAALAMALVLAKRPNTFVTVIEDDTLSASPTCEPFLVDDLCSEYRVLLDPAVVTKWNNSLFSIDGKPEQQRCPVALLHNAQIHSELAQCVSHGRAVLGSRVSEVLEDRVVTNQGTFTADLVVDARMPRDPSPGAVHVLTEWVELARPHGLPCPILIDTEAGAAAGWSFVQYIPVGASHLLIRGVGHGLAGGSIDIAPTEGRLLASRQVSYPLIAQRHRSGEPLCVPIQCPHPLAPSELSAALGAAAALFGLPSLSRCHSETALFACGAAASARRLKYAQICQELASVRPPARTPILRSLLAREPGTNFA